MIRKTFFFIMHLLCVNLVFSQLRYFDEIFPSLDADIRAEAFSDSGFVNSSKKASGFEIISLDQETGIDRDLITYILGKNPGFIVESIIVISAKSEATSLLDVYNALGNIRGLKGKLYSSHSKNKEVPLFEDATRIVSDKKTSAISDPPPALSVPQKETVYLMLKDVNFGSSYYRGEISLLDNGLRYTLSNFKSLTYFFVPVIKEDKFTAQLYFEPINEGVLIYGIASADISDFFASKISINSAIAKRLAVIISWAADGIVK